MQTIRHVGFLWDDQLPVNLQEAWIEIANDLKQISEHRSTRYTPVEEDVEIHAFADASAKAYGTAIYLISNGKITLIFAKARLTPTRKLSIPKLELLAALITSRAINFIESAFRKTTITRKIMWSDSYVENRVTEIRKVPNLQVKHVPSALNPADLARRGCSFKELPISWWEGPAFLRSDNHYGHNKQSQTTTCTNG